MSDEPTNQPDNPAQRLLGLCQAFLNIKNGTSIRDAWAQILNVEDDNTPELLYRVGMTLPLVKTTREALERLDEIDRELFLGWQENIEAAFSNLNFKADVGEIKNQLKPEIMKQLEFCSHELRRRSPEPTIAPEQLTAFREEVKNLMDEVLQADIPVDLKSFLLDNLDRLLRAIEMYWYTGSRPIQDALDTAIGQAWRGQAQASSNEDEGDLHRRFWDLCGRIAIAFTLVREGSKLLEYVPKELLQ